MIPNGIPGWCNPGQTKASLSDNDINITQKWNLEATSPIVFHIM